MSKARELAELGDTLTVDGSGNIDISGKVTAGDVLISGPTPFLTILDTDGTNKYTNIQNGNGSTYIDSRNDTLNGPIIFRGVGGAPDEYARFDASGKFGIGASNPTQKLEVAGNILMDATDASLLIKSGAVGTTGSVDFTFNTDSASFASLSLSYDTRDTVGLLAQTISAYPVSISSGTANASTNAVILSTSGTEAMRIDNLGRVGIGESDPDVALHVNSGTVNNVAKFHSTDSSASIYLTDGTTTGGDTGVQGLITTGDNLEVRGLNKLILSTGTTDRMTIDASGNLLVGKPSANFATTGIQLRPANGSSFTQDGEQPLSLNRLTSDGDVLKLFKDGLSVGGLGAQTNALVVEGNSSYTGVYYGTVSWMPRKGLANSDNAVDLGAASNRFDDLYATNGTIQTSDRNEKQDIDVLDAAETAVAQACKGLLRKFRWKDSVAEKGDDARIHFGIIAQDLQDAFAAQGLDAGNYAMFISGTWWEADRIIPAVEAVAEELDEDGNVIVEAVEAVAEQTVTDTFETLEEAPEGATERTRLGVRYPELLAFIIGAM